MTLSLQGVSKLVRSKSGWRSTSKPVLKNVTFTLTPGETTCLIGENGAGKTTIVRILAGFWRPDEGKVICNGQTMTGNPDLWRGSLAVVSSFADLYPQWSVRDNIQHYLSLRYATRKLSAAHWEWPNHLIDLLKIREFMDWPAKQLSTGQRQRASIARGLATQPVVAVLDEPTNGIDITGRILIHRVLAELRRQNVTTLLVSHYADEIANADRVLLLGQGQIRFDGSVGDFRGGYTEEEALLRAISGTAEVCS